MRLSPDEVGESSSEVSTKTGKRFPLGDSFNQSTQNLINFDNEQVKTTFVIISYGGESLGFGAARYCYFCLMKLTKSSSVVSTKNRSVALIRSKVSVKTLASRLVFLLTVAASKYKNSN
jgi:hypothetical protein